MKYSLRSVILIKKITPYFYVLQYKTRNINGFKLKFNLSSCRTKVSAAGCKGSVIQGSEAKKSKYNFVGKVSYTYFGKLVILTLPMKLAYFYQIFSYNP